MDIESYDESEYISDDYDHPVPGVFYTVTRILNKSPTYLKGCICSDCSKESNCSCLKFGPNYCKTDNGLVLLKEKFGNVPVFECNVQCSCFVSQKCLNRNVQYGPVDCLEIFDAGIKGLGLRTKNKIPAGAFICEYAGEVIELQDAIKLQKARDTNYIFILREHTGDKLSSVTCVDPTQVGNIGRYINHSCQPNSMMVPVRVNDIVPWLCIFALRNIEEGEEICYDYGRGLVPQVPQEESNQSVSRKLCFCGAINCKKYLPFEAEI